MTRILLQFPGGEVTLARYRVAVPLQQATKKAASLASDLFDSWDWSQDGDIPAIVPFNSPCLLLIVNGPTGKECIL